MWGAWFPLLLIWRIWETVRRNLKLIMTNEDDAGNSHEICQLGKMAFSMNDTVQNTLIVGLKFPHQQRQICFWGKKKYKRKVLKESTFPKRRKKTDKIRVTRLWKSNCSTESYMVMAKWTHICKEMLAFHFNRKTSCIWKFWRKEGIGSPL